MKVRSREVKFIVAGMAVFLALLLTSADSNASGRNRRSETKQTETAQSQPGSSKAEDATLQTRPVDEASHSETAPVVHLQVLLDRAGFSPGEIDGQMGSNTIKALRAFQKARGLPLSDKPDESTLRELKKDQIVALIEYQLTEQDVTGPFVETIPEDMMQKAELPRMAYTSVLESLAEKFHAHADLIRGLNSKKTFSAGESIIVPNVEAFVYHNPAGEQNGNALQSVPNQLEYTVVVSEEDSDLVVYDSERRVVFFAPVTAGSQKDPLPLGTWKVKGIARDPEFLYNPELFWDSDPSHAKAKIAPGPNNPVGVVWIDINVEHYGIHGSPAPGRIGYEESHGCVRMTNWDAMRLAELVRPGTKVIFQQ